MTEHKASATAWSKTVWHFRSDLLSCRIVDLIGRNRNKCHCQVYVTEKKTSKEEPERKFSYLGRLCHTQKYGSKLCFALRVKFDEVFVNSVA